MAIPQRFLDDLVARSDLAELASRYTNLVRRGGMLKGLCPFHSEKTPSFQVNPDLQVYYCFGCHAGGGVLQFVMNAENLDFVEAVHFLAGQAGLVVPEDEGGAVSRLKPRRDELAEVNKRAAHYFHDTLMSDEGRAARQYLTRRGISEAMITRFGLGASESGWDGLLSALTAQGVDKNLLLEAGLAVKNSSGGLYDRFRGRVMFPIIDVRKRVIGFGGRILDDGQPKYLNTPETLLFSKGKNLYALNFAKNSKRGRIVLTEGYMDALALYRAGFDNAVASLGTALTDAQAQLLARYTKEVVLAFDADQAGQAAIDRSVPILRAAGLRVSVARLSGAKDPDEYLQKFGRDALEGVLSHLENHMEFRLDALRQRFDLSVDQQKVQFIGEAIRLLAGLDNRVEQEVYAGRVAQMAGVARDAVLREARRGRTRKKSVPRRTESQAPQGRLEAAEGEILRCGLRQPELLDRTSLQPEDFQNQVLGRLFALMRAEKENLSLALLQSRLDPEEMTALAALTAGTVTDVSGFDDCVRLVQKESLARKAAQQGEDYHFSRAMLDIDEKKGYGLYGQ